MSHEVAKVLIANLINSQHLVVLFLLRPEILAFSYSVAAAVAISANLTTGSEELLVVTAELLIVHSQLVLSITSVTVLPSVVEKFIQSHICKNGRCNRIEKCQYNYQIMAAALTCDVLVYGQFYISDGHPL